MKQKLFTLFLAFIATTALWAQNNVITYTASSKLPEWNSASIGSGISTRGFNVSISNHSFSNGIGIITFSGDVTSIGNYAFNNSSTLISITIPNSVASIGSYAFKGCSSLTSVIIGKSMTSIESNAFKDCSGIKSVQWNANNCASYNFGSQVESFIFGDSVQVIPSSICNGMSKLTSITIPNSVTNIGSYAFCGCSKLTSITIPNSVTSIGSYAFKGCSLLASVIIGQSVTSIGNDAFYGCSGIKSVQWNANNCAGYNFGSQVETFVFGDSVQVIPNNICSGMSKLTSVTLGNSVTSIKKRAFYNCSSLTSLTIPEGVKTIGEDAFYLVSNIVYNGTATGSPWGAKSVNGYVEGKLVYESAAKTKLLGCSNAASGTITIPKSVTSIGNSAFTGCYGLTSINVESGNTYYTSSDGVLFNYSKTTLIQYPIGNTRTSYMVPDGVTSIGAYAFEGCSRLTSIFLPPSLKSIGTSALSCVNLKTICNNSSVLITNEAASSNYYIVYYAKNICSGVLIDDFIIKQDTILSGYIGTGSSITIPDTIKVIGKNAFYDCSFTSITLPNHVTIESNAFYKCSQFITINVKVSPFVENMISSNIKNAFSSNAKYNTSLLYSVDTISLTPTCAILRVDLSNVNTSQYVKMSLDYKGQKYMLNDNITTIAATGLLPNADNTLEFYSQVSISTDWSKGINLTLKTPALELTTLAPKVTSTGEAIVCATTNMSDNEQNAGFEWRKYNAPSEMESKSAFAYIYNGSLQGKIKNLSSEYYKVRAFYEAADGTRFYGEWKTFDPTESSYFDPEVHTYFLTESPNSKKVSVRGFVMAGTDEISKQGFEYWEKNAQSPKRMSSSAEQDNNNVKVIYATGQIMSVTLEDLEYEKTYYCRAFATTSEGTIYGEQIEFTTPKDTRPQYTITLLTNGNGTLDRDSIITEREGEQITINAIPNEGYQFSQWSDGNTDNPRTIIVSEDMTLIASFVQTTGLVGTKAGNGQVQKIIRDGQLYILRNGKTYNAQGGEL